MEIKIIVAREGALEDDLEWEEIHVITAEKYGKLIVEKFNNTEEMKAEDNPKYVPQKRMLVSAKFEQ